MGYGDEQLEELEATINAVGSDLVVTGTPMDLGRLIESATGAARALRARRPWLTHAGECSRQFAREPRDRRGSCLSGTQTSRSPRDPRRPARLAREVPTVDREQREQRRRNDQHEQGCDVPRLQAVAEGSLAA